MWLSTGRKWQALDARDGRPTSTPSALTHVSVEVTAMAIKFVDIEPEDTGRPKRSEKADAPPAKREPDAEALKPSVDPELPHAKPAPKKRGRK